MKPSTPPVYEFCFQQSSRRQQEDSQQEDHSQQEDSQQADSQQEDSQQEDSQQEDGERLQILPRSSSRMIHVLIILPSIPLRSPQTMISFRRNQEKLSTRIDIINQALKIVEEDDNF